jgi:hypothetical protein
MAQYVEKKNELEERGKKAAKNLAGAFVAALIIAIIATLALIGSNIDLYLP